MGWSAPESSGKPMYNCGTSAPSSEPVFLTTTSTYTCQHGFKVPVDSAYLCDHVEQVCTSSNFEASLGVVRDVGHQLGSLQITVVERSVG